MGVVCSSCSKEEAEEADRKGQAYDGEFGLEERTLLSPSTEDCYTETPSLRGTTDTSGKVSNPIQ